MAPSLAISRWRNGTVKTNTMKTPKAICPRRWTINVPADFYALCFPRTIHEFSVTVVSSSWQIYGRIVFDVLSTK